MVLHGPLTLLLVPFLGLDHVPPSYVCLFQSYYGTYGSRHAFLLDDACRLSSFSLMELGIAVEFQWGENLVWVERSPVDSSLIPASFEVDLGGLLSRLAELPSPDPEETEDIQYLTGEDPSSDILSRHSFSEGAIRAASWLQARFEETGASCTLEHFQEGFAPNVICEYAASGNSTERVIVGAHYDDRGSFGSVRAPGANDDGSGTGALLALARAIARLGVVFRKPVRLCAFAGEEQMMVGSRAYATKLRERGDDILLMVQGDMLAYHAADEPPQLGLSNPTLVGTAEVAQILANVSAIYSPELTVGYAPYPGGSDHQSFHEQGYPSAQVYERAGYIKDPMYHDSGDLSEREGYDFEQIKSIAKVQLATVLHVAGFDLSGDHSDSSL
ncbi:hypothetical protein C8T65DRAFT_729669 [Cerioporus squamosus]|nr:hypothetical protein C8T65DRAFT_729669 [Cerioporus squamosus]